MNELLSKAAVITNTVGIFMTLFKRFLEISLLQDIWVELSGGQQLMVGCCNDFRKVSGKRLLVVVERGHHL